VAPKRDALGDILHNQEGAVPIFPRIVDGKDVGVIELAQHPRFLTEPLDPLGITADFPKEYFDRDVPVECGL
jgi:hypothetical protein